MSNLRLTILGCPIFPCVQQGCCPPCPPCPPPLVPSHAKDLIQVNENNVQYPQSVRKRKAFSYLKSGPSLSLCLIWQFPEVMAFRVKKRFCIKRRVRINRKDSNSLCALTDIILTFLSFELQKWFSSQNWSEFSQEFNSELIFLLEPLGFLVPHGTTVPYF